MSAEILLTLIIHDRCGLFCIKKKLTNMCSLLFGIKFINLNKERNLKTPLSTPLQ